MLFVLVNDEFKLTFLTAVIDFTACKVNLEEEEGGGNDEYDVPI
jgi:hypothetical protein